MALTLGTNVGFVLTAPTADPGGADTTIDGSSVVVKDTSPAGAVKITQIGWYRGTGTNTSNFEVALYADTAGSATTRLNVDNSNSSNVQGWITVAVDWSISASTAYWLAVQMDAHTGSSTIDSATSGGSGSDVRTSQTTLADPYGGGAVADADGMYAIYALCQIAPTVTLNSPADTSSTSDTTPDLVFTGTDSNGDDIQYNLQLCDDNTFPSTDVTESIPAAGDDYRWYYNALYFANNQADIGWGYGDATYQANHSGLRFTTVAIPQGAKILSARLDLIASETTSDNAIARIYGVDADNASAATDYASAEGATLTTAYVDWSGLPAWTAESTYSSPDISSVIQEIVDRAGWASGNAMVIYIKDNGTGAVDGTERKFYAYDGNAAKVAQLIVTYSTATVFTNATSGVSAGFSGTPDNTSPFASGQSVTYTVQSALAEDTYYWKVRGKDPSGANTFGAWTGTWSLTISSGTAVRRNPNLMLLGVA